MASTYVNDLRLNEMATGDQSGSWGTVTNTNLELIAEAFSFGTEGITTNADTHTTTIADGGTDPGRSMFLKYTGTLDSACTITIGPNTVSKLWFIENGTSGSQNIIIKQGSGATITIPPGDTKAIYSDGAGSGGKMVDAFASLSVVDLKVQDDLTVTDDVSIGGTLGVTGIATFTDDIIIGDGKTIGSASTVGAITIASDGDITLSADLNVGANFDVTGNAVIDGTALVTGGATINGSAVFNQDAADVDFRVEGNEAFAFFVHGADSSVQMGGASQQTVGTLAPGRLLLLNDNNSNPELKLFRQDTSIGNGANLGEIVAYSNDTADNDIMPVASVGFYADGTFSATNNPSQIIFFNTPASSETIRQVGRFDALGNFEISSTGGTIVTATAGTSNFRAGSNAGNSIASGGIQNVFVGDEAGTAITTGDYNSAFGYKALFSDTLGNRSVAIGREALLNQNFTSDTNAYNIAVGYGASLSNLTGLQNTNLGAFSGYYGTTADNNTFVGYAAGFGNAGSAHTGNNNTGIGSQAGSDIQGAATDNTFVGFDAGKSLTTATKNTHVGTGAGGVGVITGTRNNSFGYQAGLALTSGTNNVFMGSLSGKAISTGVSNTVCGEAALITEAGGDKNTAIGAEALKAQNGGRDGNVAVGYYAGFALTEGENNTIIGTEAMSLSAITSDKNVAVGYRAGKNLTTGSGNVIIGKSAGADTTLLTTGTQNVLIGPLVRPSAAGVNNEIVIGYFVGGGGEGTATIGNGNGKISVDFEANATWSYSSDERLKKDIVADDLGLSFINRLETVKYKWKPSNEIDESLPQYVDASSSIESPRKTDVVMHGMIAQTVKAALDAENVDTFAGWSEDLDGTQKISREMFVTPLIKAVQELSTALDAALARIAVLEG